MADYRCPYCANIEQTWLAAKEHTVTCKALSDRIAALGFDLEMRVRNGFMKLEDAEKEQAARPKLILDD